MQLCSSNIKNFLIFSYILRKGTTKNVFIFKEMETLKSCLYFKKWNFSAQAKKKFKKICSEKISHTSKNGNTKKIPYIFSKESSSYILENNQKK